MLNKTMKNKNLDDLLCLPVKLTNEDMAVLNDLRLTGEDIPAEYLEAIINSDEE